MSHAVTAEDQKRKETHKYASATSIRVGFYNMLSRFAGMKLRTRGSASGEPDGEQAGEPDGQQNPSPPLTYADLPHRDATACRLGLQAFISPNHSTEYLIDTIRDAKGERRTQMVVEVSIGALHNWFCDLQQPAYGAMNMCSSLSWMFWCAGHASLSGGCASSSKSARSAGALQCATLAHLGGREVAKGALSQTSDCSATGVFCPASARFTDVMADKCSTGPT
jgi:hypothetical protein